MQRQAVVGLLGALIGVGCVGTTYVPQVRDDFASALVLRGAVLVYVNRPTVRAISFRPPYACDARTLALATRGVAPTGEAPDEIERFSDFGSMHTGGPWAVQLYSGPDLEPGAWLYVEPGDESEHAAMTALNVVNRYNSVAACVARARAGR